jgi:formamidopyrimidine-DNA glycosylase
VPELPEVESLRRSLLPYIDGQTIRSVKVLMAKLVSSKGTKRESSKAKQVEFESNLVGEKIIGIERRAKNLIFRLSSGAVVLVHLKMTGQLVYKQNSENGESEIVFGGHPIQDTQTDLPNKHTYVIFNLDKGTLYYNDVRQFGYLLYYKNQLDLDKDDHFSKLGLEPFSPDFTEKNFVSRMKTKKGVLKKLFLDQKVVVGLGNIYCDEVCFASGVLPTRKVETLTSKELSKLYKEIKRILAFAVDLGGSSIANYLLADGSRGNYAREHKVYNRSGLNCIKCGNPLKSIQLAGRTTVFCDIDQK